jgi:hypothetical protein
LLKLAIQDIQGMCSHNDQAGISFTHKNIGDVAILKLGKSGRFFPRPSKTKKKGNSLIYSKYEFEMYLLK